MTSKKAVGKAVRDIRIKANKTLQEGGEACGHGKQWLSNIESGIRRLTFNDAKTLTDFYGSTLKELAELSDYYDKMEMLK